jgi:malate/lactate dehydrogenase
MLFFFGSEVNVPVVGGHAGITILPLFSQVFIHSLPPVLS